MSNSAELAALRAELAAASAKLARHRLGGRKPVNAVPLTTKQRNDLRAAAKRIAGAWTDSGMPPEGWIVAQVDLLPAELRELRPLEKWAEVVRARVRKTRVEKFIV